MVFQISAECIACGRCAKNCPIGCIYEDRDQYQIDPAKCIGCGTCASLCPLSAISEKAA